MVSIGYVVVCKRYIITGEKKRKGRHGHFSHGAYSQEVKQFENNMTEYYSSQLYITEALGGIHMGALIGRRSRN